MAVPKMHMWERAKYCRGTPAGRPLCPSRVAGVVQRCSRRIRSRQTSLTCRGRMSGNSSTQSTDGALRALFTLCREPRSLLYLLQSSPGEEHMDIIAQLKAERDKAAQQVSALDTAIGALSGLNSTRAPRGRRTMSAAARARIAAAQRARWAKVKGQRKVVAIAPKRKISAAGLARIRAANKARWAKWRGGQK